MYNVAQNQEVMWAKRHNVDGSMSVLALSLFDFASDSVSYASKWKIKEVTII